MENKEISYEMAVATLFSRKDNRVYNQLKLSNVDDINVLKPFTHKSLKRSFIEKVEIRYTNILNCAWTGTVFQNVSMVDSVLRNSNMQQCVFEKMSFHFSTKEMNIRNCTFDFAIFKDVSFNNVDFICCNFSDVSFIRCRFSNCRMKSCNLDGTRFSNCVFSNYVVRNLNMDYSIYHNCQFNECEISAFQCPYAIGLLQLLDKVCNNSIAFQGKNLNIVDYINLVLPCLVAYFEHEDECFPLANLFGFLGDADKTKYYLNKGIRKSISLLQFRVAIHYCNLISYYNYLSSVEKRCIIEYMNNEMKNNQKNENIQELLRYSTIIEKNLLSNYENRPVIQFSLKTSLNDDSKQMIEFIQFIDMQLNNIQGIHGEHQISFAHNSPWWLDIIIAFGVGIAANYAKEGIDQLISEIKKWIKMKDCPISTIVTKEINSDNEEVIKTINTDD